MFTSVLIANRGEIAVRVIRTLRRLGVRAIAVHSDADARAPHVRLADAAVRIGPAAASESYLRGEAILDAAARTGAEAIHPGYGFLSENAGFARAVQAARLVWIGPPPEAIELLGDKAAAKAAARAAGVPVVPGSERPLSDDEIRAWASEERARIPLMIKAAAGGGGRGMRVVRALDELDGALAAARREAVAGFGDDRLLVERFVERARHVEVQVLADAHGAVVHLGERECSLQRRHQKVIEESPSPAVDPELRAAIGAAAVALARSAGYAGAGTIEFLVPSGGAASEFFFLELNARLQVEHPVTELVCGLDLVEAQLRVAAGEPLWLEQDDVALSGWAIEARVCAEDPARDFLPGTGRIVAYAEPAAPGVRVDSGIEAGGEVSTNYDSLLCKVIAHAPSREGALERLDAALARLAILGPPTNTSYLRDLLAHPDVQAGRLDTGLIARIGPPQPDPAREADALAACALARTLELQTRAADAGPWEALVGWRVEGSAPLRWRLEPVGGGEPVEVVVAGETVRVGDAEPQQARAEWDGAQLALSLDGERTAWAHARDGDVTWVGSGGRAWGFREPPLRLRDAAVAAGGSLEAPMPGSVLLVHVAPGDRVAAGDVLVVLESMKMELSVQAPADGVVSDVAVSPGDRVTVGQPLVAVGDE